MIRKIKIQNIATIKDLTIEPLQINYIFGGNGSGKTSISKYLSLEENYDNGSIIRDDSCEVLVYNKDFVDNNFQDKNSINGIFTIGESAVEAIKAIEEQEAEKAKYQKELIARTKSLEGLQSQIDALQIAFEDNCWEAQKDISTSMPFAITGTRNNKKAFAQKCLESYNGNRANYSYDELLKKYQKIFQNSAQEHENIIEFDFSINNGGLKITLNEIETHQIFSQKLVKATESNFSKFIESLGNVDWVSQGMKWIESSDICPFCQRKLSNDILLELNNLFDESYNAAINTLTNLEILYLTISADLDEYYKTATKYLASINFIDLTILQQHYTKLKSTIKSNLEQIKEKLSHPSTTVSLTNSNQQINDFISEIKNINQQIDQNNEYVKDLKTARKQLSDTVWDYIANCKLLPVISQFKKDLASKNQGVLKLKNNIDSFKQSINECDRIIREKRATVVCIDNAISEINSLLLGFGFKGFKIEKRDDLSYKLVRADGSEVRETLSEGEHRFITFLYFYQLVNGTLNRENVNKDKILVIDDPISSLDSNILFIVSYLVRELIKNCLSGGNVKQIFVLTHNIYFHQEIAYKGSRDNPSPLKEKFWVLRKINEQSEIVGYAKNQINSSYELLWQEYKNPNTDGALICNTMRRILEHYFNVIGHKDYDKIIDQFTGQDKLICKALLPFINAGSHTINDDFHLSIDLDMVDKYKEIFKAIFQKANQESHYNMMMGIDD